MSEYNSTTIRYYDFTTPTCLYHKNLPSWVHEISFSAMHILYLYTITTVKHNKQFTVDNVAKFGLHNLTFKHLTKIK